MNSSAHTDIENNREDGDNLDTYDYEDRERLIKPRNNFASYSENIDVRFRSTADNNVACSSIEAISGHPRRLNIGDITPGATNFLSTNYESLDYDPCENYLLQDEERKKGYKFVVRKNFARWFIFLLIGICTALIACFIDISIEELSSLKYGWLKKYVDQCVVEDCIWLPYTMWLMLNIVPVLIGAILVAYIEPVAAGSGIPQVKCYLNGVKIPRVVRIKTLAVKTIGVICTVVGGLAGGKEGPMIHSGAIVAAGISQGKSTTFRKDLKIFKYFREDHEKRDFVSGGAASGVSAAFGAPIGGVLFSIEEGTSFFNQSLTWRTFFASMITTFTLNVILSAYHGHLGDLSYPGLLNLGKFESIPYQIYEIPLFMIVGTFGGLLGALWNHVNYKITCFRLRFVTQKWLKVMILPSFQFKCIARKDNTVPSPHCGFKLQKAAYDHYFTILKGIYDIHTQMAGIPLLPWESPPLSNNIYASEIMSHPIVSLKTVENVGHIVELLKCVTFNGFPVVDPPSSDQAEINSYGRFRGLILRSQLIVLLKNKVFNEYAEIWEKPLSIKMFRNEYPRYPTIEQIAITDEEKTYTIDLRHFMNPCPYTIQHSATLPRTFRLFRALGLRHVPVVNDTNEVIGIITRKDVARFRIWKHRGRMGLDELLITNKI
ncbi:h+ cl- exchange transporter 7-like protein [Lasius niger]|uniref:Chloride channel protein n=1 Tax=Lasius niger TaxID=67767 RepID=A0A0J7N4P9_LASNI|nr:h+ cl- exchange transporter 7-like protein [Lasius niger]